MIRLNPRSVLLLLPCLFLALSIYAETITLLSDEGFSISLDVKDDNIDDCLILRKIFDNLKQLYQNTPIITGTYFHIKKQTNYFYEINRIRPSMPRPKKNAQGLYSCMNCDFSSKHYGTMHSHVIGHLGYLYHCARCGRQYKSSQAFRGHKRNGICD